jgi:anti-sigma-K factor RskA
MTDHDSTHELYDELAAGYALHALEPDEELLFTEHLATCSRCAEVLDEHAFVAAQLGSLADAEEVPVPEWRSIRSGVVGDVPAPAPDTAPVVSLDARRTARRSPRLLAAAAGLVAVAGVGVLTWQTVSGGAGNDQVTAAIARCQSHAATCKVVRLHDDHGDPAVVLVSGGEARLLPIHMGPPTPGHQYVLWQLPRSNGPTAIGEFTDASHEMTTRLLMPYADTAAFAVSLEPADTPPTTPSQVLATGQTTA